MRCDFWRFTIQIAVFCQMNLCQQSCFNGESALTLPDLEVKGSDLFVLWPKIMGQNYLLFFFIFSKFLNFNRIHGVTHVELYTCVCKYKDNQWLQITAKMKISCSRWWQLKYFLCSPRFFWVFWSKLTTAHIFRMGWFNHQRLREKGQSSPSPWPPSASCAALPPLPSWCHVDLGLERWHQCRTWMPTCRMAKLGLPPAPWIHQLWYNRGHWMGPILGESNNANLWSFSGISLIIMHCLGW